MNWTGGDLVVKALEDEGIEYTFGIPGTHNIELYDCLSNSEKVRPILVTDEQSASFMADGAWRATGKMACVNIVPGAGLTHAMSGIAEAFMDNVPMLVLGCGIRRDTGKSYQLHHVDQLAIAGPVTKGTFLPTSADEIYPMIRQACRLARSGAPGPVMVEIPANLYLLKTGGSADYDEKRIDIPIAGEEQIDHVATILNRSKRPLIYTGLGAAAARNKLIALAEKLQAPVATTIQGKGVFPESHALALWPGFGKAAPPFAREIVAECDMTLAIGCRFGEVATGSYGGNPPKPLIHVDIDETVHGKNYPTEIAVHSDALDFLSRLVTRIDSRKEDADLHSRIRDGHKNIWEGWLKNVGGPGVTPAFLIRKLQESLGNETIFTADSGNGTFLAMEHLRLDQPGKFLAPVDYSCMGYSVPAALGAKIASKDKPVVALAGDGAFLMTGLELLTAATQEEGLIVMLLHDRELGQIAQFQDVAMNRKTCTVLPDYDPAGIAQALGLEFLKMDSDDEVQNTISRAVEISGEGKPVLVDVNIDYSSKTFFTKGVVSANFGRLPWKDRFRFAGRALVRKVTG